VHSDLDDTMTAPVPAVRSALEQPDVEHTIVPGAVPPVALDPHMWPADSPAAAWPPTVAAAPVPNYYGFRIGNSQIVLLDAIAYIGRRPGTPRVVRGGVPRLVRVQSPSQEVSSTHLELRQVGSTVVAQDLHSTNGTMLAVPGHPVRALRPGESVVVTVGSLIDIGDRNVIEILPLQVTA
jgi:pSer/pThr/pTyr-binding forkhead associated (FHA) protein